MFEHAVALWGTLGGSIVGGIVYIVRLEGDLKVQREKFNTIAAQFNAVDHRFLAMESSLARIEAKLDRVIERRD